MFKDPKTWTNMDVFNFMSEKLGCIVAESMRKNNITGVELLEIDNETLRGSELGFGPLLTKRILVHVETLNEIQGNHNLREWFQQGDVPAVIEVVDLKATFYGAERNGAYFLRPQLEQGKHAWSTKDGHSHIFYDMQKQWWKITGSPLGKPTGCDAHSSLKTNVDNPLEVTQWKSDYGYAGHGDWRINGDMLMIRSDMQHPNN